MHTCKFFFFFFFNFANFANIREELQLYNSGEQQNSKVVPDRKGKRGRESGRREGRDQNYNKEDRGHNAVSSASPLSVMSSSSIDSVS